MPPTASTRRSSPRATVAGKREAARLLVDPDTGDVQPDDAVDFIGSTGAWANSGNDSITGLDLVDLWVGGLAENTNPFGGLLGTTFNYVFESQLLNLQNGDRFYYLDPYAGHEPAHPARRQLVRRDDDAQHDGSLV